MKLEVWTGVAAAASMHVLRMTHLVPQARTCKADHGGQGGLGDPGCEQTAEQACAAHYYMLLCTTATNIIYTILHTTAAEAIQLLH